MRGGESDQPGGDFSQAGERGWSQVLGGWGRGAQMEAAQAGDSAGLADGWVSGEDGGKHEKDSFGIQWRKPDQHPYSSEQ